MLKRLGIIGEVVNTATIQIDLRLIGAESRMDYARRPLKSQSLCLLCGKSVTPRYLQTSLQTKDHLYLKWAQSYSKSLCELLDLDQSFRIHFQNADYCSNCLQIIREIDFTLQALDKLQKQLHNSRETLKAYLHENNARCQRSALRSASLPYKVLYDKLVEQICGSLPVKVKIEAFPDFCIERSRTSLSFPIYEKPAPASVKARRNSMEKVENVCSVLLGKRGISKPGRIKLLKIPEIVKSEGKTSKIETISQNITALSRFNENSIKPNQSKTLQPNSPLIKIEISTPGQAPNVIKPTPKPEEIQNCDEFLKPLQKVKKPFEPQKPTTTTGRIRLHCTYENCSYSCFNEVELNAHVLGQHKGDSNPYHCHACPLKYTNSSNLKYHIRQHHSEKPSEIESFLSCTYCGKKFIALEESAIHKRHESLHARSPIFSCVIPKCKTRQFSSSVDLKNHVALKHEDSVPVSKCLECNLVCANPKSLRKHIKNIHCERNPALKCKECSYIGRVPSDIVLHMTKHSDERNFQCPECNATYKNKCSLGFHMKNVHLKPGEKKHKCGQCPMAFSQASILKKHEQSHATCKLYACKKCDTRFKHIATLQAHEKHSCKGVSGKKQSSTMSRNRTPGKAAKVPKQLLSNFIKIETAFVSKSDELPPVGSEISICTEESSRESTSISSTEYYGNNSMDHSVNYSMPFPDPDPLDEFQEDDITSVQPMEEVLDSLICSADTEDYNWINPDLFGEDFSTLDIFEEVDTCSLISSALP